MTADHAMAKKEGEVCVGGCGGGGGSPCVREVTAVIQ